jgi:hypothetical protein
MQMHHARRLWACHWVQTAIKEGDFLDIGVHVESNHFLNILPPFVLFE